MSTIEKPNIGRTSSEWWRCVSESEELTINWLQNQYHSEATAGHRIRRFAEDYAQAGSTAARLLLRIASQEDDHAEWVGNLLVNRDVEPTILNKNQRYWSAVSGCFDSLEHGAAIASHVEHMSLEMIRVITSDSRAPTDVRKVFTKILPQEVFHERAFRSLSTPEIMEATRSIHAVGRSAIGLSPEECLIEARS